MPPQPAKHHQSRNYIRFSPDELELAAKTIVLTAGDGGTDMEFQALAGVLANRLRAQPRYGNTLAMIAYGMPYWHTTEASTRQISAQNLYGAPRVRRALIALLVALDEPAAPFGGATLYHLIDEAPVWAQGRNAERQHGRVLLYLDMPE